MKFLNNCFLFLFCSQLCFAICDLNYQELPKKLSETCFFEDIKTKTIDSRLEFFTPNFPLWSDGAEKKRYIYLPPKTQIRTEAPNDWSFPVGTIFWKEFSKDGKRLEVRLLKRISDNADQNWIFGTYEWNESETEGHFIEWEKQNVRGTTHDIPSRSQCYACHGIEKFVPPKFDAFRDMSVLGFNALDLSSYSPATKDCAQFKHALPQKPGLDLKELIESKRITQVHEWNTKAPVLPGTPLVQETLSYLHNNCGSCHRSGLENQFAGSAIFTGLSMRGDVKATSPQETPAYLGLVGVKTNFYRAIENMKEPKVFRVVPGSLEKSVVWHRFNSLGFGERMPAEGSKTIDPYGKCLIKKWILSLSQKP